jgi:hypothetical protein
MNQAIAVIRTVLECFMSSSPSIICAWDNPLSKHDTAAVVSAQKFDVVGLPGTVNKSERKLIDSSRAEVQWIKLLHQLASGGHHEWGVLSVR